MGSKILKNIHVDEAVMNLPKWKKYFEAITACSGVAYVCGTLLFINYFFTAKLPMSTLEIFETKDFVRLVLLSILCLIVFFSMLLLPSVLIYSDISRIILEAKESKHDSNSTMYVIKESDLVNIALFLLSVGLYSYIGYKIVNHYFNSSGFASFIIYAIIYIILIILYLMFSIKPKFLIAGIIIMSISVAVSWPGIFIRVAGYSSANKYLVFIDKPNSVVASILGVKPIETPNGKLWASTSAVELLLITKNSVVFKSISSAKRTMPYAEIKRDGVYLFDKLP